MKQKAVSVLYANINSTWCNELAWELRWPMGVGVSRLDADYRGGLFAIAGAEVTPAAGVLEGSADACTVLVRLAICIFLRRATSLVRML